MYRVLFIFFMLCAVAEAQPVVQIKNRSQHPYLHIPIDMNAIDTPSDGECLAYDGATTRFEWVSCSGAAAVTDRLLLSSAGTDKLLLSNGSYLLIRP